VEAAVRLGLADALGLAWLRQLKGAEAIIPISTADARNAEHRADRLLSASATTRLPVIDGETAEILREGCVDFLVFLRDASFSTAGGS
jgi:hypothetical protein